MDLESELQKSARKHPALKPVMDAAFEHIAFLERSLTRSNTQLVRELEERDRIHGEMPLGRSN